MEDKDAMRPILHRKRMLKLLKIELKKCRKEKKKGKAKKGKRKREKEKKGASVFALSQYSTSPLKGETTWK